MPRGKATTVSANNNTAYQQKYRLPTKSRKTTDRTRHGAHHRPVGTSCPALELTPARSALPQDWRRRYEPNALRAWIELQPTGGGQSRRRNERRISFTPGEVSVLRRACRSCINVTIAGAVLPPPTTEEAITSASIPKATVALLVGLQIAAGSSLRGGAHRRGVPGRGAGGRSHHYAANCWNTPQIKPNCTGLLKPPRTSGGSRRPRNASKIAAQAAF